MKHIILIPLVALFFSASSQHVTIKLKTGESKTVRANANTSTELMISTGNIKYTEIDSLIFHGYNSAYDQLRERLLTNGIKVGVTAEREGTPYIQSSVVRSIEPGVEPVIQVDYNRFVNQRNGGKLLQFAGVAALGITSYLTIRNQRLVLDGKEPKEIPKFLPWAALGAMGVGIIIDMDAGKHLKKR